jgi:DNA-binding NtrC family response regulator
MLFAVMPAGSEFDLNGLMKMKNSQKLSILYFDDEPVCLEVFREAFGDDYEVRTASTLKEARRALDEEAFDVVISDQVMPEISGTAFLREIANTHPQSFRIMMSGNTYLGDLLEAISAGVVKSFVPKPWNAASMRQAFERARL